jgi:UDP-N-acetylmuramyl pentapeptide synthase
MLNQALSPYGKVAQTSHNANLPKGTAWNLASVPWDSDYVILEMAIGGMEQNTKMVRPDIAIFTNVAPAHLTFHNSTEEIARKKSRIFSAMEPGSFAIINRDMDEWSVVEKAALENELNIISFGQHPDSDIRLLSLETDTGLISVNIKGKESTFTLASSGIHMAINALSCLAVIEALEIQGTAAQAMMSLFKPIAGRGEEIKVNIHGYSIRVIDDAYNANPISMKASLQAFAGQKAMGRKVLVLGDMLELAENSDMYHTQLVSEIIQANADTVFITGEHMEKIHPLLKEAGITCHFRKNIAMLQAAVVNYLKKDDLALFKSSNGVGLHKIVKHLIDLED